jgi:hypothetical protein
MHIKRDSLFSRSNSPDINTAKQLRKKIILDYNDYTYVLRFYYPCQYAALHILGANMVL